jgi:uncharacterized protein YoxC
MRRGVVITVSALGGLAVVLAIALAIVGTNLDEVRLERDDLQYEVNDLRQELDALSAERDELQQQVTDQGAVAEPVTSDVPVEADEGDADAAVPPVQPAPSGGSPAPAPAAP